MGDSKPPSIRSDTDNTSKNARQVSLITQSAVRCDVGKGLVGLPHQCGSAPYALVHDISLWARTKTSPEGTKEVTYAEMREGGEIRDDDLGIYVRFYVRAHLLYLPPTQTTAPARGFGA